MTDELEQADDRWEGAYFDGRSATRHIVTVTRTRDGLLISGPTVGEMHWAHHELKREMRVAADEPVRYERGGATPEVLVIADPRFLPAVRRVFGGDGDEHEQRRRNIRRLLLPALAVVIALVSLYAWGIPRLADRVAPTLPLVWEERLGQTVVNGITTARTVCAEPERAAALNALVATLTADGRGGRYRYNITVVEDPMVNALAAPGGEIVIFTGLLQRTATPDELAGVLAHEIQHVVQQHGAKNVLRQVPLALMLNAISGNEGIATNVVQLAGTLSGLTYQRRDEADADLEGLRTLQAARIAPDGMLTFFRKLAEDAGERPDEQSRLLEYVSTHPSSSRRFETLAAEAAAASYESVEALTPEQWSAATATCTR